MKYASRKALMLMFILCVGAPLSAQCGSAELAKMNTLSTAFQNDVTIFDSLTRGQLETLQQTMLDCTKAITSKAERAGMKDMHEMSKDDLILLYWISGMHDTASMVVHLLDALDAQKCQKSDTLAKTEIPGKGPCTNVPERYDKLEERLAWFYGCMHKDPPSIAEIRAKIAALPPEKRKCIVYACPKALEKQDFATQEALLGVASYDLPIQVFPK